MSVHNSSFVKESLVISTKILNTCIALNEAISCLGYYPSKRLGQRHRNKFLAPLVIPFYWHTVISSCHFLAAHSSHFPWPIWHFLVFFAGFCPSYTPLNVRGLHSSVLSSCLLSKLFLHMTSFSLITVKWHLDASGSQFSLSTSYLSPKFQVHISNIQLAISTWLSNEHSRFNIFKMAFFILSLVKYSLANLLHLSKWYLHPLNCLGPRSRSSSLHILFSFLDDPFNLSPRLLLSLNLVTSLHSQWHQWNH